MDAATNEGETIKNAVSATGFSAGAVQAMMRALVAGGGSMAQFAHAEFGGAGQWMRGGMVMAGAFGDHALKSRIDDLCHLLASDPSVQGALANRGAQHQSQSNGSSNDWALDSWWPATLGHPDVTGSQNDSRYAWFAEARRLAIETDGCMTVYDTGDHRIGGVSQQQGGPDGLSFSSQHGTVALDRLELVSHGPGEDAPRDASVREEGSASSDAFDSIERLATLHERGLLDDDEYRTKKAELLKRI